MAELQHTTRRALLKAAAPAFAAVPFAAMASEAKSPIRALYHQWLAAEAAYNQSTFGDDTPEAGHLIDRFNEIQETAMRVQPQTVEDFAFLVLFADESGYLAGMSPPAKTLVEMARRLAGMQEA